MFLLLDLGRGYTKRRLICHGSTFVFFWQISSVLFHKFTALKINQSLIIVHFLSRFVDNMAVLTDYICILAIVAIAGNRNASSLRSLITKKKKLIGNPEVRSTFRMPINRYIISKLVKCLCSILRCGQIVMTATRKSQGKKDLYHVLTYPIVFIIFSSLMCFFNLCRFDSQFTAQ